MRFIKFYSVILFSIFISACSTSENALIEYAKNYKPGSVELYNTILKQDSIFFNAYNTCDLKKQAEYYSDDIEFFHDQGGLTTSKKDLIDATEKNICGKVTRTLVKNSVEVYSIKGYGAVEMGIHKFKNKEQVNGEPSIPSKFVIIWHQKGNSWEIAKVISLH